MKKNTLKSQKRQEKTANTLSFIAVIVLAAFVLLPIWWIFRSSLMNNAELFAWPPSFFPKRWLFSNYTKTLALFPFWKYFKNTMIIIVPSVIGGDGHRDHGGLCLRKAAFQGEEAAVLPLRRLHAAPHHGDADPALHHLEQGTAPCGYVLAVDSAVFLRRRRVQHLSDLTVYTLHSTGAGRGGNHRRRGAYPYFDEYHCAGD